MKTLLFAIVFVVGVLNVFSQNTCETIKGLEGCACRWTNSGKIMSLQNLTYNSSIPDRRRFITEDQKTKWKFAYNPCGSFDLYLEKDENCKEATVGRFTDIGSEEQCFTLGTLSSGSIDVHDTLDDKIVSNLTVKYKFPPKAAVVSLICNPSIAPKKSKFVYLNVTEGVEEIYYFSLESKCCCPGGCAASLPSSALQQANHLTWLLFVAVFCGYLFV